MADKNLMDDDLVQMVNAGFDSNGNTLLRDGTAKHQAGQECNL